MLYLLEMTICWSWTFDINPLLYFAYFVIHPLFWRETKERTAKRRESAFDVVFFSAHDMRVDGQSSRDAERNRYKLRELHTYMEIVNSSLNLFFLLLFGFVCVGCCCCCFLPLSFSQVDRVGSHSKDKPVDASFLLSLFTRAAFFWVLCCCHRIGRAPPFFRDWRRDASFSPSHFYYKSYTFSNRASFFIFVLFFLLFSISFDPTL